MTNIYTIAELKQFSPRMKEVIAESSNELEAEENYLIEKGLAKRENGIIVVTDDENYGKYKAMFSTVVHSNPSKNPKEIMSKLTPKI